MRLERTLHARSPPMPRKRHTRNDTRPQNQLSRLQSLSSFLGLPWVIPAGRPATPDPSPGLPAGIHKTVYSFSPGRIGYRQLFHPHPPVCPLRPSSFPQARPFYPRHCPPAVVDNSPGICYDGRCSPTIFVPFRREVAWLMSFYTQVVDKNVHILLILWLFLSQGRFVGLLVLPRRLPQCRMNSS